jgi:hypothetical protein
MTRIEREIRILAEAYEEITGKPFLLYVSRPGDGKVRYVFADGVKIGTGAALAYIAKKVLAGKPKD